MNQAKLADMIRDIKSQFDLEPEREAKEEKKTQSQILVNLASDMYLFYDEQGRTYARVMVNDHYEIWPIRSSDFKHVLTFRYLNLSKDRDKAPGSQAMEDALKVLEAKARIEGKKERVFVRVAEADEAIYLDLCNEQWEVVEITKKGWRILNGSPVYFRRSKTMEELPRPEKGASIELLKRYINYRNEPDFKLIIAWLLSTFKNSPFPILNLQGEQGSAKSTTTKVLKSLVDPSSLPLRALPKDERDLAIAANQTWVLAFDNLSGLSNVMSDAFCKLSTGGGLATRKLYTDDEEAVFNIMRPVILNGIDDIAKRQDLLDRSIILNLPPIDEEKRQDEKTFWGNFKQARAGILGALCDIVSVALRELPDTKLTVKPRMADFALWVTAAEKALEWTPGEFIQIYTSNRDEAIEQGLEVDPFGSAILQLLKQEGVFIGNATQLLEEAANFTDERTVKSKAWPTSRAVRNRLRRIAPALRNKGILYNEWENRKHRTLRLEVIDKLSSLASPTSPSPSLSYFRGDDMVTMGDDVKKISSPNEPHDIKESDVSDDNDDFFTNLSNNEDEDLII